MLKGLLVGVQLGKVLLEGLRGGARSTPRKVLLKGLLGCARSKSA
jgi:hypothetical protein